MVGFEAADFAVFAPGFAWAAAPVAARETANSAIANTAKVGAMAFDGWSGRKSCGGYGFRNSVIPTSSRVLDQELYTAVASRFHPTACSGHLALPLHVMAGLVPAIHVFLC